MKKALFNITVYGMLAWSILSAVYLALPVEYQAMLPDFNWLTAVISGGSTMLLGTGGLAVQTWLSKARTSSDEKYNLLGTKFLTLVDNYKTLEAKYDTVVSATTRNNQLLEVDLATKLSNPMLTDTARALINQVLNYDGQK